jgi:hypothetical protein
MIAMKKYLIKGALALFAGVFLFSCAEKESEYVPLAQQKAKAFEDVFKEVYGDNIDPYQKWGFSDKMIIANGDSVEFEEFDDVAAGTRSRTRAGAFTRGNTQPSKPSGFRDTNPISTPASHSGYYTTAADVKNNVTYAKDKDWNSWEDSGAIVYVDANYATVNDKKDQTIYIVGDVTYESSTQTGIVFVVTEGSTLKMKGFGQYNNVYLANGATLDISEHHSWSDGVTIDAGWVYMGSSSQITGGKFTVKNGSTLDNEGGTISVTYLVVDKNTTLWNAGSVSVNNDLQLANENAYVYNASGKNITVKGDINITNNSDLFYNDGTVTCYGSVELQNTGAEFINNKTLTVSGDYTQKAGAMTHNVGTVTVSGKTDLTNGNSKWLNECDWTTGSFDIDNYSYDNFNSGKLTVNGEFHLDRGTFVNDGGALVSCNSFLWEDTSDFYLGSKSKLNVSGTLTTNNYNSGYGFRGVGDDYAIIHANEIAKGKGDVQFSMSYYGNLYIDTNTHFAQGALDPDNDPPAQPYYYYDDTVKFSFVEGTTCPVTFTEPTCGSTPHIPETGEGSSSSDSSVDEDVWSQVTSQSGRIFCEDLGQASREDLDYNDVVFDVIIWNYKTKTTTTTTTSTWTTTDGIEDPGSRNTTTSERVTYSGETYYAQVTLMAAGGTLPLTVAGVEVHDAFDVDVSTMVNTVNDYSTVYGSSTTLPSVAIGNVTKSVKYNGETKSLLLFTGYQHAIDIPIVVNYNGKSINELSATGGKAPHKLFVPLGTKWAVERKNLALAYPGFVNYVSDSNKNWTKDNDEKASYYRFNEGDTRGLSVMPTVIKNRRISLTGSQNNLWTGTQSYGPSWSLNNVPATFNVDVLYPGDRLRFYGKGIGEEAWINVSINNTKPYLLDSDFPNFVFDASGNKVMLDPKEEGFVEVVLDETTAALLNQLIDQKYPFVVQGRNFTLTRIAVVEFD